MKGIKQQLVESVASSAMGSIKADYDGQNNATINKYDRGQRRVRRGLWKRVKELDYDQIMINPVATQMHFTMAVDFQGLKRSITTIIIVVSII